MTNQTKRYESIAINGRFLSQPVTGVQRYALELLRSLDRMLSRGELPSTPTTILVPPGTRHVPSYSFLRIKQVGHLRGQLWEQFELPRFARGKLLFTPCGGAPIIHHSHVITIHDAGVFRTPHAYRALYRNYYRVLQKRLAQISLHIITVSQFSKQELIKSLRVPEHKISVTYLSGEHILRNKSDDSILTKHTLRKGKYILGVGSRNPNKNFRGLIQACEIFPRGGVQIAIAGGTNPEIFGRAFLSSEVVKELGFVNDSQLRSLYENAACFVFPSFYEGFGLPPVEALTLGCPIVVSRTSSLPEIFGEAATYCDPYSAEDIALQISKVLRNEHPNREFALQHASELTWERCARQTWSILLEAVSFC